MDYDDSTDVIEALRVAIEQYLQSGERLGGDHETGDPLYIDFQTVEVRRYNAGLRVEVLFRDLSRPDCIFGYRHEVALSTLARRLPADQIAVPIVLSLEEILDSDDMGLPTMCEPDAVTWVR